VSRLRRTATRGVDAALEATVAPSFARVGYALRSRLEPFAAPPSLAGRRALVTGATSGIGLAVAERLAALGAEVVLLGRDADRTRHACEQVAAAGGRPAQAGLADMAEPDSVRAFAADIARRFDGLDVLVHNAGALARTYTTNGHGLETTVAAQVVSPFLLTTLLLPQLEAAAPGRVITVASGGMYSERLDLARLVAAPATYDGVRTYARVKRAQVALAAEWARRVDPGRVVFQAMHPGWVDTPGLRRALPGFAGLVGPLLRSAEQGADTIVWLAAAPEAAAHSGSFWHDRRRRRVHRVPWTRSDDERAEARRLFSWCAAQAGVPEADVP